MISLPLLIIKKEFPDGDQKQRDADPLRRREEKKRAAVEIRAEKLENETDHGIDQHVTEDHPPVVTAAPVTVIEI